MISVSLGRIFLSCVVFSSALILFGKDVHLSENTVGSLVTLLAVLLFIFSTLAGSFYPKNEPRARTDKEKKQALDALDFNQKYLMSVGGVLFLAIASLLVFSWFFTDPAHVLHGTAKAFSVAFVSLAILQMVFFVWDVIDTKYWDLREEVSPILDVWGVPLRSVQKQNSKQEHDHVRSSIT